MSTLGGSNDLGYIRAQITDDEKELKAIIKEVEQESADGGGTPSSPTPSGTKQGGTKGSGVPRGRRPKPKVPVPPHRAAPASDAHGGRGQMEYGLQEGLRGERQTLVDGSEVAVDEPVGG